MQQQETATKPNGLESIPAAPLVKHIDEWIAKRTSDAEADGTGATHPSRAICEILWPNASFKTAQTRLSAIRTKSKWISFELADKIVCKVLQRAELWLTDPELADAYQNVNLRRIDLLNPTCEAARIELENEVFAAYDEHGSVHGVAEALDLPATRVRQVMQKSWAAA